MTKVETIPTTHETASIRVLDNGEVRYYNVDCGMAYCDDGTAICVQKDGEVDHHTPDDWLATITPPNGGDAIELPIIHAQIIRTKHHPDGDYIVLTVDTQTNTPYQAALQIRFGVDPEYHLNTEVEIGFPQAHERNEHHFPALAERQVFSPIPRKSTILATKLSTIALAA